MPGHQTCYACAEAASSPCSHTYGGTPGKTERYYAVDLVRALQDEDDFRRFYLFFRRDAFVQKGAEGKTFLDRVLSGSEDYAIRVGKELKKVVFERLFARLAAGFLVDHTRRNGQPADEETLEKTYRGTLTLLYRLLFLLYAEARDLLPHRDRLGYGRHSITRLKKEVAVGVDEGERYAGNSYVIWERLESLFRIVDDGSKELNVPPYNGGLFNDEGSHEFLGTHKVSDRYLAPALDELSRQTDESGEKRFVDYAFIGVRELGSVYEGLLEFSLRIAERDLVVVKEKGKEVYVPKSSQKKKKVLGSVKKGEPYLVNDKKERKGTGTYYTPRYIVDYIVENTLKPLVQERRTALEERLTKIERLQSDLHRMRKNEDHIVSEVHKMEPLKTLLDVKVLDPAMGSGHFLVAAVDYLTDEFSRIISELDAEPLVDELADLRTEIQESLEAYGASASDEQLSDANLLKRMVLKRCVYGVDLNEMAVELAKLSLWLDTFTVGAPLSFLDHHLKQGNSLIGASVSEIRAKLENSGGLLGGEFADVLVRGTELMQQVGHLPDATEDEVKQSITSYSEADRILRPFKRVMDIWISQGFSNFGARSFLIDEIFSGGADQLLRGEYHSFARQGREVIGAAVDLSDVEHFFHWELEFPEVFYEGSREKENAGFDVVVGNPPYIRIQELTRSGVVKDYYNGAYASAGKGNYDIYVVFVERGLSLLNTYGRLGYILPHKFFNASYGEPLRELISEGKHLSEVVHFGDEQIFPGVTTYTALLLLNNAGSNRFHFVRVDSLASWRTANEAIEGSVPATSVTAKEWNFVVGRGAELFERLTQMPVKLRDVAGRIFQGIIPGADKVYTVELVADNSERSLCYSRALGTSIYLESELLRSIVSGPEVSRYALHETGARVIYPYTVRDGDSALIPPQELEYKFPLTFEYFESTRDFLDKRDRGSAKGPGWYKYIRRQNIALQPHEKLAVPRLVSRLRAGYDSEGRFCLDNVDVGGVTLSGNTNLSYPYVLGLLNSKLLNFYFVRNSVTFRGGFFSANRQYIEQLPIRTIDFVNSEDVAQYNRIVELVEWMRKSQEERLEIERRWGEWVEATVPKVEKLTKGFREKGWVEIGLRDGWAGVKAEFQARGVIPSSKIQQELRHETEDTLRELRPLHKQIERTDHLIDDLIYRLYGLTEGEIAVVESSVISK